MAQLRLLFAVCFAFLFFFLLLFLAIASGGFVQPNIEAKRAIRASRDPDWDRDKFEFREWGR